MQAKGNVAHWEGKILKSQEQLQLHTQKQEQLGSEYEVNRFRQPFLNIEVETLQEWTRLAASNWEKVEKPRPILLLDKEVKKLEALIAQGRKAFVPLLTLKESIDLISIGEGLH